MDLQHRYKIKGTVWFGTHPPFLKPLVISSVVELQKHKYEDGNFFL